MVHDTRSHCIWREEVVQERDLTAAIEEQKIVCLRWSTGQCRSLLEFPSTWFPHVIIFEIQPDGSDQKEAEKVRGEYADPRPHILISSCWQDGPEVGDGATAQKQEEWAFLQRVHDYYYAPNLTRCFSLPITMYVVNLDTQPQRWEAMKSTYAPYSDLMRLERWDATKARDPNIKKECERACALSHWRLHHHRHQHLEPVTFILEDDTEPSDYFSREHFLDVIDSIKAHWGQWDQVQLGSACAATPFTSLDSKGHLYPVMRSDGTFAACYSTARCMQIATAMGYPTNTMLHPIDDFFHQRLRQAFAHPYLFRPRRENSTIRQIDESARNRGRQEFYHTKLTDRYVNRAYRAQVAREWMVHQFKSNKDAGYAFVRIWEQFLATKVGSLQNKRILYAPGRRGQSDAFALLNALAIIHTPHFDSRLQVESVVSDNPLYPYPWHETWADQASQHWVIVAAEQAHDHFQKWQRRAHQRNLIPFIRLTQTVQDEFLAYIEKQLEEAPMVNLEAEELLREVERIGREFGPIWPQRKLLVSVSGQVPNWSLLLSAAGEAVQKFYQDKQRCFPELPPVPPPGLQHCMFEWGLEPDLHIQSIQVMSRLDFHQYPTLFIAHEVCDPRVPQLLGKHEACVLGFTYNENTPVPEETMQLIKSLPQHLADKVKVQQAGYPWQLVPLLLAYFDMVTAHK